MQQRRDAREFCAADDDRLRLAQQLHQLLRRAKSGELFRRLVEVFALPRPFAAGVALAGRFERDDADAVFLPQAVGAFPRGKRAVLRVVIGRLHLNAAVLRLIHPRQHERVAEDAVKQLQVIHRVFDLQFRRHSLASP